MPVLSPAEMAAFRALTVELAFADTYELLVPGAGVSDGAGGTTVGAETVAEMGTCGLTAGTTRPEERAVAERAGYQSPYTIELPYATIATPAHRLRVNGARTFAIAGVLRDGNLGITATAVCQERG